MENNKKNMIYSPLSIKYALKMLNDGANGNKVNATMLHKETRDIDVSYFKDKNTGKIWFIGTVYEPNLWENDKPTYEYR